MPDFRSASMMVGYLFCVCIMSCCMFIMCSGVVSLSCQPFMVVVKKCGRHVILLNHCFSIYCM